MGTFFACAIQSAICLAIFYLFYKVLLSRDTFHRFNRIALLGILILSLIIPFTLTLFPMQRVAAIQPDMSGLVDGLIITGNSGIFLDKNAQSEAGSVTIAFLLIVYLTGCTICLIYTVLSTFRIIRIIRKGRCTPTGNGTKIIILNDQSISPFSWMRYIVCSKSDYEETGETIITHENAHIRYRHSLDLFIAQLCIITQWFNPASWLLYKELQSIHEFEADEEVIRSGINAKQYQLLLIKKAVGSQLYSLANSLNHSNLKKRIAMMYQKKSNPWARLKYAYVLPLAATTVALFAQPEISQPFEGISNAKVSHFSFETSKNEVKNLPEVVISDIPEMLEVADQPVEAAYDPTVNEVNADNKLPANETTALSSEKMEVWPSPDDSIHVTCEIHPLFPGGEAALLKWISEHLQYPKNAAENKIEGRVTCQFVVEKDGSVSNVEVVRGRGAELDAEAVRVLTTLPKFKPGMQKGQPVRVRYSVPINFRLSRDGENKSTQSSSTVIGDDDIFVTVEQHPLFPGGEEALLKFVSDNILYPKNAAENRIMGRVTCQFIVEKDGSVSNVEVVKALNPDLDAEAVRVLKMLPKFKPGMQRGQPVRVRYSVPVNFKLTSG